MNPSPSCTLEIDFRHPGEAVIVLRSIIAAYKQILPQADAARILELSEHITGRLDDLAQCLAEAEFDLAADESFQPGRA